MALPDSFRLEAASSRTSGFSSTTITNGSTGTGSAIDNSSNLDELLSAEFVYSYATNPTASKTVEIYLTYAVDGSNYEEVATNCLIGSFSPAADTSTHRRVIIRNLPILPFAFKIVVKNVDTAQTITLTVNAYTHSFKIVD